MGKRIFTAGSREPAKGEFAPAPGEMLKRQIHEHGA